MSESGPEYARRYEYNTLNQLVRREESRTGSSPTALAYEYDLRGNRVREKSAQDGRVMKEFSYDGANRMVGGTTEKGSSFYRYDGLGRRVGREWEQGSERKKSAVQYVVDFVSGRNDDLAAYTQGFFAQNYSYANGQRIAQVAKAWEDTANQPGKAELPSLPEELYIHEDIMGSTRRWSTGNGDTYAQMEYDVWGLPIQPGNEEENILNPRYTNHTYDDVLGMYHAQFRFLDVTNRSFTTIDPIKDGLNWYGYCDANPTSFIDPLGLAKVSYFFEMNCIADLTSWAKDLLESIDWDTLVKVAEMTSYFGAGVLDGIANSLTFGSFGLARDRVTGGFPDAYFLGRIAGDLVMTLLGIGTIVAGQTITFGSIAIAVGFTVVTFGGGAPALGGLVITIPLGEVVSLVGVVATGGAVAALASDIRAYTYYKEDNSGSGSGGSNNNTGDSEDVSKVDDLAKELKNWLGEDARVITNQSGDKVFISKDGARRVRFDINNTAPHSSPHGHIEELVNGVWRKSGPIYPD